MVTFQLKAQASFSGGAKCNVQSIPQMYGSYIWDKVWLVNENGHVVQGFYCQTFLTTQQSHCCNNVIHNVVGKNHFMNRNF